MANRKPFKLRKALFLWNFALAAFSITGSIRFLPEIIHTLKNFGFHQSVCSISFVQNNRVTAFWTFLFSLSKLPELFDTMFIILRKQKLMFLHWYHHITVFIMAWYSFGFYYSPGRW